MFSLLKIDEIYINRNNLSYFIYSVKHIIFPLEVEIFLFVFEKSKYRIEQIVYNYVTKKCASLNLRRFSENITDCFSFLKYLQNLYKLNYHYT